MNLYKLFKIMYIYIYIYITQFKMKLYELLKMKLYKLVCIDIRILTSLW